jgi:hypothetical protein
MSSNGLSTTAWRLMWYGGNAPCILKLNIRWEWELSFTLWLLHLGKESSNLNLNGNYLILKRVVLKMSLVGIVRQHFLSCIIVMIWWSLQSAFSTGHQSQFARRAASESPYDSAFSLLECTLTTTSLQLLTSTFGVQMKFELVPPMSPMLQIAMSHTGGARNH